MSILRFLGIVNASSLLAGQQSSGPLRQRKLMVEKLDSRALLTLFTPIVTDMFAELVEVVLPPEAQPEPSSGDPDPSAWEQDPPANPYAGSQGGEGGASLEPVSDPPSEPITDSSIGSGGGEGGEPPPETNLGSGGGSAGGEGGDPPPEPDTGSAGGSGAGSGGGDPPPNTGSGSGSGGGGPPANEDPVIASASYLRMGGFVIISGLVTDDGPLGGLTVVITTNQGQYFTTQTTVLGAFASVTVFMSAGTRVSIHTVDSTGNHSDSVLLIV